MKAVTVWLMAAAAMLAGAHRAQAIALVFEDTTIGGYNTHITNGGYSSTSFDYAGQFVDSQSLANPFNFASISVSSTGGTLSGLVNGVDQFVVGTVPGPTGTLETLHIVMPAGVKGFSGIFADAVSAITTATFVVHTTSGDATFTNRSVAAASSGGTFYGWTVTSPVLTITSIDFTVPKADGAFAGGSFAVTPVPEASHVLFAALIAAGAIGLLRRRSAAA